MKLVSAVVVAVVVALAPAQACAASSTDPTRILIVGDSVTHGLDGEYSWRYFSWRGLQQTGAAVDFVGPSTGTVVSESDMFGGSYAAPDFDQDHASRYGRALWQMVHWPDANTPRIEDLVAEQDPDVLVEMLGFNDLAGPWVVDGVDVSDDLVSNLRLFVERARSANPDVDIVLGTLPQVWFPPMARYNDLLPAVAAELSTPESRVVVTPVVDFTHGVDTYDDAHPTTLGQRKIAEAVSAGLEELGIGQTVLMPDPVVGPEEPPVVPEVPVPSGEPSVVVPQPEVVVPPAPVQPALEVPGEPRWVRAVREGGRTAVTWRRAVLAERYVVRCGSVSKSVSRARVSLRSDAGRCKVRSVNAAGASSWVRVRVRT